jgi:DNA-binding NarL/FixJ family response regulator
MRRVTGLAESQSRAGGLREVDVVRLLATGLSSQEIGAHLHISANTVASQVRSILGAANRTQAAIYAAHHGLV